MQDIVLKGSVLCTVHFALSAQGEMASQGFLHFSCRQACLLGQSWSVVHSAIFTGTYFLKRNRKAFRSCLLNDVRELPYFLCKLNHKGFLGILSCIHRWPCGYGLCSQHLLSSLRMDQHIFHFCMPGCLHTLGLRGTHIAGTFHMDCPYTLDDTCNWLCDFSHYSQH